MGKACHSGGWESCCCCCKSKCSLCIFSTTIRLGFYFRVLVGVEDEKKNIEEEQVEEARKGMKTMLASDHAYREITLENTNERGKEWVWRPM